MLLPLSAASSQHILEAIMLGILKTLQNLIIR